MSHTHHERILCEKCESVIMQCRCMENKTNIKRGLCRECSSGKYAMPYPSKGSKCEHDTSISFWVKADIEGGFTTSVTKTEFSKCPFCPQNKLNEPCPYCQSRTCCLVLTAKPQPKDSEADEPILKKYKTCGCVICTCENEIQCQGCGAKNCGDHSIVPTFKKEKSEAAKSPEEIAEEIVLESFNEANMRNVPSSGWSVKAAIISAITAERTSHSEAVKALSRIANGSKNPRIIAGDALSRIKGGGA